MKGKKLVVTIDGPAGTGKTTVAQQVAWRLGYIYLDSGAMYRALALNVLKHSLDLKNKKKIVALAKRTPLKLEYEKRKFKIFIGREDVTKKIRTPEVTSASSKIAVIPAVREVLHELQRKTGQAGGVVAEGRDMGSYVFPQAEKKIFLDASTHERAKRRWLELKAKGEGADLRTIEKTIRERDGRDSLRKANPLKKAEGAIYLDTTNLSIEEVVDKIISLVKK